MDVSLSCGIQLNVVHVKEAANGCSTLEPVSITTVMIRLRGFRPMQNSRGDRASPWLILHLMLTFAVGLEMASRVVFHSPTEFFLKALIVLLMM